MSPTAPARLTVTAKGQVTLRRDLLAHMGAHPGDKLSVSRQPDGTLNVRADRRTGKLADMAGFLKGKTDVVLTIDEINEAIAKGWAGER